MKRALTIVFAIIAVALVLSISIYAIRYFNDPQRRIDAAAKDLYASATEEIHQGNFDMALRTLDLIDSAWTDYERVATARMRAIRGSLLKKVDSYNASGNYETLIQLVDANVDILDGDMQVKTIYENAISQYRDSVLLKAEEVFKSEGYEAAISVINKGLSVLLGDTILKEEKDLYATYAPVDLTSLTPYFEGVIDAFTDGIKDTMGNTYRTGMRGYMSTSDSSRFDCFHIWDIGCQYNTLTATGIIREGDKGSRCEGCYRIYGDGILLYERNNIGSTTKPYSIEVDITGVTDLKIEMYGEGNMGTGGMDSVLVDVMLHKK